MRNPSVSLATIGVVVLAGLASACPSKVVSNVCNNDADCSSGAICQSGQCVTPSDAGPPDAGGDAGRPDAGLPDGGGDGGPPPVDGGRPDAGAYDGGDITNPCTLAGSWVHDSTGYHFVGGDPADDPDAPSNAHNIYPGEWLQIPEGFCAHHFAKVPNARQIRFAPGGELFVASPNVPTTGGSAGLSAIVVLPDDDHDGVADSALHYKDALPATQGLMFANDSFYYQDTPPASDGGTSRAGTRIVREPYVSGQRVSQGGAEAVVNITTYTSALHWPKTLDISDNGTIYVGNGGDQGEACQLPMPFHGGIVQVDGTPGGNPVVKGLRNPIDVKCHRDGHNYCFATELARDYSAAVNGREKLVLIHPGDNWGFPCCATQDSPFPDVCVSCNATGALSSEQSFAYCRNQSTNLCSPDCSGIAPDTNSFLIGDTPFGFDFVETQFPDPWSNQVIVALHGAFATWTGARVVSIAFDPETGLTHFSTDIDGGQNEGHMRDFLTGWDDGRRTHGRPSDIAVAADGRLFVANDDEGEIFWVAHLRPEAPDASE